MSAELDGIYAGSYFAWSPNGDGDSYRLIGTLSDGREVAVQWVFQGAPGGRGGDVIFLSRKPDPARDELLIRAEVFHKEGCLVCDGAVDDARLIAPDILRIDYEAASQEFMRMVDDTGAEEIYSELEQRCPPCVIGTVTFEYDLATNQQRLVSATIDDYQLSQEQFQDAHPKQVCFDKLLERTVDTLPHTFSTAELKTFVSEFRRVCLGS